jgi:hypothetical protein
MTSDLPILMDDMPEPEAREKLGEKFAYAIALGVAYCRRCARDARSANDMEQYGAYRTAVRVARLIAWVNEHGCAEPTLYNGDGTLTVACVAVDISGRTFIERDVIPATLSAARDLLGY